MTKARDAAGLEMPSECRLNTQIEVHQDLAMIWTGSDRSFGRSAWL